MKYIIYWVFYSSSLGDGGKIAGVIGVTDSTVISYLYDVGYVTWKIKHQELTSVREFEREMINGYFALEYENISSILYVKEKEVEHYIATSPPVHIRFKRKKRVLDK